MSKSDDNRIKLSPVQNQLPNNDAVADPPSSVPDGITTQKPPEVVDLTQSATDGTAPNSTDPVVVPPAVPPKQDPPVAVLSAPAKQVQACLTEYLSLMSQKQVNKGASERAANLLRRASEVMINAPTDEVLDLYWQFHVKHKTGVMHEKRALQGVNTLDARSAELVMTLYTAFRHYVLKDSPKPADQVILRVTRKQQVLTFLKSRA